MLRTALLVVAMLCIVGAIALAIAHPGIMWLPAFELFAFGALVCASLVFERHYRTRSKRTSGAWQPTDERFIDPTTGKLVDVYFNATTGERDYREVASS